MLVVAVQFCLSDYYRMRKLVELLNDTQVGRRDDVCLLLATADEFVGAPLTGVGGRCEGAFVVDEVQVGRDFRVFPRRQVWKNQWSLGYSPLWQGTVEHFLSMDPRWSTLLVVDGGNGVPLHRDWVDHVLADHERTLKSGKLVTAGVFRTAGNELRLGGNLVLDREVFQLEPGLFATEEPAASWGQHYEALLGPHARASSLLRYDQGLTSPSPGDFARVAETSAWWHGCREGDFVDRARDYLGLRYGAYKPRLELPGPAVLDFGAVDDLSLAGNYSNAGVAP